MEGVGSDKDINCVDDEAHLYNAMILLQEYAKAYLQSITFEKFLVKGASDWQIDFTDMVKSHIAILKKYAENADQL